MKGDLAMVDRVNLALLKAQIQIQLVMAVMLAFLETVLLGKPVARRKGLRGEVSLEWVLVGGIMVVIIGTVMMAVVKPNFETIVKNIMDIIVKDTSNGPSGG